MRKIIKRIYVVRRPDGRQNNMQPHGFKNLGGHEKPQDNRDILLGAAAPAAYTFSPTFTDADAWDLVVEYQQDQPACGAHAGAEIKAAALRSQFSPRFTWADIKTFDGFPLNQGTDMRSIFKSITKTGVLDWGLMGNDASLPIDVYAKPTLTRTIMLNAATHAGMGYGFINDYSFDGIKQFIYDHGPAIILLRLGREWWSATSGANSWAEADILPVKPPSSIVSGHFVLAHSYDEKNIYFLNHWSSAWGRKGHGYFQENYMPFINDAGALFPLKFTKDLFFGMTDPDVLDLQRYLNSHGYPVSVSGPGSSGHETNYFGSLTQNAVMKFQSKNFINPTGYFGPLTRAFIATHA